MDSLPIKSSFQIRSGRTTCHTLARRPINQVGILCVRVRAGPGLQQVLGDAEPAGQRGGEYFQEFYRVNDTKIWLFRLSLYIEEEQKAIACLSGKMFAGSEGVHHMDSSNNL